jgi:hypothetical protein
MKKRRRMQQRHFDFLVKNMNTSKTKSILEANGGVPGFFVRILVNIEDFFNNRKKDKVAFRKLSPRQGRAFNRMVLTAKKHAQTQVRISENLDSIIRDNYSGVYTLKTTF